MLSRSIRLVLLFVTLTVAAVCAQVSEPIPFSPALQASLDAALQNALASKTSPSISMAVVRDGQVVYARAVGLANVADNVAATPQTRYRVGSVSKTFTALAVMQLVEAGRLQLDAPYGRWLAWGPHAQEITVRQLLLHRSGLPNYLDRAIADGSVSQPTTPRAIMASVAASPLDFAPGTAYEYSNTNYVLLGLIVEQISGLPLSDYLERNVYRPVGMTDTTFSDPPAGTPLAVGYNAVSGAFQVAPPGDPSWYYACGSMVSTASDLARFDVAFMQGKLLPPGRVREMVESAQPTLEPGGGGYGLGLQTFPLGPDPFSKNGGTVALVGHHGGRPGYESDNEMIVQDGFAVVVLGNSFEFRTGGGVHAALASFYPQFVKSLIGRRPPPPSDAFPALTARITAFVRALQAGKLDESMLDPVLQKVLPPDKASQVIAQFAPLGPLQSATWLGVTRLGGDAKHHYKLVFANRTVNMAFVVNNAGKLEGFFQE